MGKVITLDGAVYNAEEIVFHTPSEHKINGKRFDMEMQIIHRGVTTGDVAKSLILCILFKKKAGIYNKFIDKLDIFNLPNRGEPFRDIAESLFIPYAYHESKDPDIPMMNPFSFYTYQGSETQPPCTERSIMYVTSKPIYIGTVAIEMFKEALKIPDTVDENGELQVSMLKLENYRSEQKLNGRAVFHFDHLQNCGPSDSENVRLRRRKPKGHFEKKIAFTPEYFYVNSKSPSGMPGAYVVSREEAFGRDKN